MIHNASGILLTLFYGLFLFGNLSSEWPLLQGCGRRYRTGIDPASPLLLVGIFVGEPHPYPHSDERKFNPLQKLFYLVVMFLLFPVLAVTAGRCFPERCRRTCWACPESACGLVHTYTGFCLSLFMVVHMYLGTRERRWASFLVLCVGEPNHSQTASRRECRTGSRASADKQAEAVSKEHV